MKTYSHTFNAFDKPLRIFGDWAPCLSDLRSWYAMPLFTGSDAPELTLEVAGAVMEDIERIIPLPEMEYKIRSGIMMVNQNYDYATYAKGCMHWIDYAGAGRIMIDFEKGSALSLICGDAMLPTYQKYLFVEHPLDKLLTSKGIFSMHASCAQVFGKGIAFTGNSGAGKSTAAFALMRKGMPILTDEKLFIFKDKGYAAGSISDIIKVKDDVISNFFASPGSCREYDVIAEEHYLKLGGSKETAWQSLAPLKVLCMLEQTGLPETEVKAVSPTRLAGGLFPVTITGASPQFRAAKFGFITEMLENIECRLVKFGTDMNDFAAKIEELAQAL
ncbi:MAG TPA: hypothetical protein VMU29_07555 [Smithella sp.]|nr:hypothetical protein [Smithella sp.]